MRNNLGTALALFLLAGRLAAQTESGTIVGTVTDQAGAAVPAVKITLLQKSTGFTRAVATNGSGQYAANSIPTGPYSIVAETPGFEKLVRSGLQLTAAETLTVDLQLTIGSVQETVEVTATGTLVQDQTAVVSNLVTNRQILDMPLNGRAFTSLLLLTPGIYAGSSGNLTTSPYAMRGSTNYSVNGSTPQNNSYLIDGITNRNLWLNTLIIVPTADSIQEFRVMTSNYSAEYGAAAGAVTIVQTKSGTNAYHGTAYEFLRNDKLDANTFFNNRGGLPKAAFHRNEFGATTGGPIQRDKTFFFADYQGILIRQPETLTATIPTLAQRQAVLTGNFTGIVGQIFDPATAHLDASGKTVRDPFPNNTIPAGRLDPAALRLIGFLPQPTSPAATRNFTYNPRISQNTDQFDLRLDQNFAQSDRIFFKYSFDNSSKLDPGVLPAPANASIPIAPYLSADGTGTATDISLTNWSTTLNYTKVFGSATVNEARLGVVRWNQYINPLGNAFATASAIGIPGINITDKSGGLPALLVTGFQVIGDNSTYPENSQTVTFDLGDTLTLVRGSHTWKFGASLVRNRFDGFSNFPARGSYDFNGQFTRQIGAAGSQTALADFALGAPDSVNRNILSGTFGMRYYYLSGFGDDTWRITNRLTLNYGLRHELFAPPLEVHDRWSNFNLRTAQLEIAGRNGSGRRLRNFDLQDFGPRLGATYALTRDRKTVLRTGMGISYVEAGKGGGQLYKNLPFFFNQTFPTDQNAAPPLFLRDGLPAPVMPSVNDTAALSTGSPTAWDYSLKSARIFQWSFGLQREIRADLLLDIPYVGTRGEPLIGNVNIDQSFPGPAPQGPPPPFFHCSRRFAWWFSEGMRSCCAHVSGRMTVYPVARHWLVPDFAVMFMTPPPVRPISAS